MNFATAVRTCLSKYVTFSGRARRSEFWWFVLFGFIGGIAFGLVDLMLFGRSIPVENGYGAATDFSPLSSLFSLAIFLPSISVAVRRLHDTGRSGWWWWLVLIPLIGWIVLIVWYATQGTKGPNNYGPDPLGAGPDWS